MDTNQDPMTTRIRRTLLALAHEADERAANEAATVPYWTPYPPTVQGNRAAADLLRSAADTFLLAG